MEVRAMEVPGSGLGACDGSIITQCYPWSACASVRAASRAGRHAVMMRLAVLRALVAVAQGSKSWYASHEPISGPWRTLGVVASSSAALMSRLVVVRNGASVNARGIDC